MNLNQTEPASLMEYFTEMMKVGYEAGVLVGVSMGVSIAYPVGIISGLIIYKYVHKLMGGHILTKSK